MISRNLLMNLFFPKYCQICQREGDYLCEDCKAMLDISGFHKKYQTKYLSDLYFPLSYQNKFIKNLIHQFKYEPFIKELAKPLANLIIEHFQLLDQKPSFNDCLIVPAPLAKKRLKWRGFNQSEEIAKELAKFFRINLAGNVLVKTKTTLPQMELKKEEREKNIKDAFVANNNNLIKDRKILLIDDIYTTGSTMEECARVLKQSGAKQIIGIVIARG